MKSYQAYLFDFDYTLADSSKGIVMCYRNVPRTPWIPSGGRPLHQTYHRKDAG